MTSLTITSAHITGLVLAGGQGRRMGTVDKGLISFRGRPMVMHVVTRLAPQVASLMVNANQNIPAYTAFGHPVISDDVTGFAGPLAGLHAGLQRCSTDYLLTAPCDSPFLPDDLAVRLARALIDQHADLAVAKTGHQAHPVFCLVRAGLLEHLGEFLRAGGRKVDAWYASLRVAETPFDDQAEAFVNLNTPADLQRHDAP